MFIAGKIFLWLPVLIHMGIIYYFSSQPAGSPTLEGFPVPAALGHFVGYFILGGLLYRAFAGGVDRWYGYAAMMAVTVAVLYGIFDEIHQSFVPGRDSSVLDVLINAWGIVTAVAVIRLFVYLLHGMGKKKET